MVAKFRLMRLYCHIQIKEVAKEANISPQRLIQFETRYYGFRPKDPERLIKAFETVLERRKKDIEKVQLMCKHQRETVFDYAEGGESL